MNVMPLIQVADFKTIEQAFVYNMAGIAVQWNFVTSAGVMTTTAITPTTGGVYDIAEPLANVGMYSIEIPASGGASANNDAEGYGWITGSSTAVLPFRGPVICFRAAAINDALCDGGDLLDVNATQWLGTACATPTTAGVPEVDVTHVSGTAQTAGDIVAAVITNAAGTDIAADIIALKADTAAILADTGTDGVVVAAASKTGYTLAATTGLGNQTANITGNLSGSVGSVTGLTTAGIADATWDELTADHAGVGSTGAALAAAGGSGDPWATALPGAYGAGTAGKLIGDNINAPIATVDTVVDGIATTLGVAGAGLTAIGDTRIAHLDAAVSTRSTYAGGAVASVTGAVGSVTGLTVGDVAAIKATTDKLDTALVLDGAVYDFTAAALAAAPGGTPPSAASIADAVWDEAIAGHAGAGSTGAALSAAGAAGDPWSTAIPGAYGAGTAGSVVGGLLAREATVLSQFGITWGTTYPLVNRDGVVNVPRGDVYTLTVTLGASFPTAGRTVYFIGQKSKAAANTTAIVNRAMTVTDPATRTCTITLTAVETATAGQYHYEIELRDTADDANPSTAEAGTLNIIEDLRK